MRECESCVRRKEQLMYQSEGLDDAITLEFFVFWMLDADWGTNKSFLQHFLFSSRHLCPTQCKTRCLEFHAMKNK